MMIPKDCLDPNPATQALHQNLYNQLGPEYKVIQRLKNPIKQHAGMTLDGTLFWVKFRQQSLFLYLSDAPSDFFDTTQSKKSIKDRLLNNPEFLALMRFQTRLLPPKLHKHKASLTPFLMIFNNIDNDKLNIGIKSLGIYLFGKDKLASNNNLRELIKSFIGKPLSPAMRHHIRCEFSAELAIYSHQVDKGLLDNEQEIAIKTGILKPIDKSRFEHLNLRSVHGDINSGKTETILHRAKLINQSGYFENNQKVLILSPDQTSKISLNKRYYSLHPTDKNTEILSLTEWCATLLKSKDKIVDEEDIFGLVNTAASNHLSKNKISIDIFFQELNFILGRTFFDQNDYLKADRSEQTCNLTKKQLKHIWKILQNIKSELALSSSVLAAELPQLLLKSLSSTLPFKEHYDHVLIDDAHLFPPIAFELMRKVVKPKVGQLFISQNPNQRLINTCNLWKETSLDLRGNCTSLMHNYQINPYILNAASSFFLHRLPEAHDRAILRSLPDVSNNPMPQLLHFHSTRDEKNRLLDKIKKLIHNDIKLKDILLITTHSGSIHYYEKLLAETLEIPVEVANDGNKYRKGLGICSLSHAHGQVASHVFIVGLQHIYDAESNISKNYGQYKSLVAENTHKLTMAMTCAKKDLTLFITSEVIPIDFISPHIDIPTINSENYAEVRSLHG
ncbi:MAG: hypothetical protein L3J51_07935 [Cocleimonas sp.]|nr:hypothetical protein [Cocleimonas sp.]